jgi:hypothetical protein
MISGIKTQWIEEFLIPLESSIGWYPSMSIANVIFGNFVRFVLKIFRKKL